MELHNNPNAHRPPKDDLFDARAIAVRLAQSLRLFVDSLSFLLQEIIQRYLWRSRYKEHLSPNRFNRHFSH
jgi:hypothetical protein